MKTRTIDIPEELLDLLKRSRLGKRSGTDQVRTALAIHLFLEGLVSVGKAAELEGEPRMCQGSWQFARHWRSARLLYAPSQTHLRA